MTDSCPICMDALDSPFTMLECGRTLHPPTAVSHKFHMKCLNDWQATQAKNNCPTCRRVLPVEEVSPKQKCVLCTPGLKERCRLFVFYFAYTVFVLAFFACLYGVIWNF